MIASGVRRNRMFQFILLIFFLFHFFCFVAEGEKIVWPKSHCLCAPFAIYKHYEARAQVRALSQG